MSARKIARRSFVKATVLAGGAAMGALAFSRSAIYLLRKAVDSGDESSEGTSRALESTAHIDVREGEELVVGRSASLGRVQLQGGGRVVIRGAERVWFSAVSKRA